MAQKKLRPLQGTSQKKSKSGGSPPARRFRSGKRKRPKVIVVLGPTSSGKSELGVAVAKKHGGEIISADSRQVYRYLDVSSSKVPGVWKRIGRRRQFVYKGIPHHLISVASPRKSFSVQQYKKKAKKALIQILAHKNLPIIVGGTGFYIDTLVYDLDIPEAPPNRKLRKDLEELTTDQLLHRLRALDPQRAETIDEKNRRRIIRAIEIVVTTGTQIKPIELNANKSPYDLLVIGIRLPEDELKDRIGKVVEKRIEDGVVDEIRRLRRRRVSWRRIEDLGLEFNHIADYIRGHISLDEMKEKMTADYLRYAKRQITWFKRNDNIIWIGAPEKALPIVRDFLAREDAPLQSRQET